jgi:hypothetical protein
MKIVSWRVPKMLSMIETTRIPCHRNRATAEACFGAE